MGLGNAIGNFLIGNTNPNSDGLAVSTGIGEGQAQVLKPYSGEAWRQASQMNYQREEDARKRKDNEIAAKSDLLKQFGDIGTYRPQEFENVNYRQKKLQDKILSLNSSAPDYPQKLAEVKNEYDVLKEVTSASRDAKKVISDLHEDITSGTKYYSPQQIAEAKALAEESYSVIDDDKAFLDKVAGITGKLSSIYSNEGLIKDWTKHEKELAGAATMGLPETKTYTNKYGQLITETTQYTDPKALEESATRRFESSPQIQANYGTLDNYLKAVNNQATFKARVSNKFPPNTPSNKTNVGGNTVSVGNVVLNPPIKSNQAQTLLQDKAWLKYKKTFEDAQEKIDADESLTVAQKDQRKLALKKQFKPEADFKSKFSFSNNSDVVPYSVKGLPENPTHQFTTVIDGKDVQIDGQSNLFNPKANAFVVETDKGTFLAPVNKNTQYLSDNGMTIEDLNKAVSKVGSGNVVTTNKEGDIVKTEKVKTFDYSKGAMQAKAKELGISVQELKNKILSKKPTATFE